MKDLDHEVFTATSLTFCACTAYIVLGLSRSGRLRRESHGQTVADPATVPATPPDGPTSVTTPGSIELPATRTIQVALERLRGSLERCRGKPGACGGRIDRGLHGVNLTPVRGWLSKGDEHDTILKYSARSISWADLGIRLGETRFGFRGLVPARYSSKLVSPSPSASLLASLGSSRTKAVKHLPSIGPSRPHPYPDSRMYPEIAT